MQIPSCSLHNVRETLRSMLPLQWSVPLYPSIDQIPVVGSTAAAQNEGHSSFSESRRIYSTWAPPLHGLSAAYLPSLLVRYTPHRQPGSAIARRNSSSPSLIISMVIEPCHVRLPNCRTRFPWRFADRQAWVPSGRYSKPTSSKHIIGSVSFLNYR